MDPVPLPVGAGSFRVLGVGRVPAMPGSILGTAVRRVEDPDLLLGRAQFVDDLPDHDALHLVFVRSTAAHARIVSVDVSEARSMPGVEAVFVASDLGLAPVEGLMNLNDLCKRPPLADGKVRFVGDAVAAVLASSRTAAVDAAETVIVDYDQLPAAIDPEDALAPDAAPQFEALGSNLAAAVKARPGDDPLAGADVVVRARIENQRSEEHTSELQSRRELVCRLLLEKKNGFDDSGKDAGILASSWGLYQAQETLSELFDEAGVELLLFHGRGGSVGRGVGSPVYRSLA